MWSSILAFNSFIVVPASFIFMVYASGQAVFFWHWKIFWISLIVFIAAVITEMVLAGLSD